MGVYEIFLIGVGLSMDAVAVSMTTAMVHKRNDAKLIEMACLFGLFQGIMPLAGYGIGAAFSDVVTRLGGILVMIILGVVGFKMVRSGLCIDEESCSTAGPLTHKLLLAQAVATSLDALAVGVGFRAQQVQIVLASGLIALTTLMLSLCSIILGKKFGDIFGKKAEVFGGALLIIIGIKAFF